jgi:SynChlorMet cassette radical SAM/SPASM protein ScmF
MAESCLSPERQLRANAICVSSADENMKETSYPLRTIYFYLTEGCNLACRHCWVAPKYQREGVSYPSLPIELFRAIIDQAKPLGLSGVKLTGGEPLLHPNIEEILQIIKGAELRLSVESNGVLCTEELAKKLAECKRIFISVSLDGVDAETHEWVRGVPGCFESAINGVRNLVKVGLKPQIIMTLMRRNKGQMEKMISFADSLGADSVKFNIIQPTSRGETIYEQGEALSIEELVDLGRKVENETSKLCRLRIVYSHPLAFRPMGRMFGENGCGCGVCGIRGILGVLSDGSYALQRDTGSSIRWILCPLRNG